MLGKGLQMVGLKVNCDGAFDRSSFEVGLSVVVRDCNGMVVTGSLFVMLL